MTLFWSWKLLKFLSNLLFSELITQFKIENWPKVCASTFHKIKQLTHQHVWFQPPEHTEMPKVSTNWFDMCCNRRIEKKLKSSGVVSMKKYFCFFRHHCKHSPNYWVRSSRGPQVEQRRVTMFSTFYFRGNILASFWLESIERKIAGNNYYRHFCSVTAWLTT